MAETHYLGTALRRLRRERGLTQRALGELAGVSRVTVAVLETGSRATADAATVERLARALGVSPAEFFAPQETARPA